jgi:hypothetical protein
MPSFDRLAFHAAGQIRDRLIKASQENLAAQLPDNYWREVMSYAHQVERALARGWPSAARAMRQDLARAVDFCCDRLKTLGTELERPVSPLPSLNSLYHEILALYEEFEAEVDVEKRTIIVTTEDIALEGIYLGPFRIRLHWEELGNSSPYRVVALDPHPAAANEDVTHPHVQNEHLCEGDGQAAIRSALLEGRLGDFFLLVVQILRTYGRGSAYIELDDWDGVSCADCGESIYHGERFYCNRCDSTLCDPCARSCAGCECTYCAECLESCARCGDCFCDSCLSRCKTCQERVCDNCLTHGLCEKCHAKSTPHADELVGNHGDREQGNVDADPGFDPDAVAASNQTATPAEPLAA